MSKRGDFFLLNECFAANRTFLTICQTCFGAGCSLAGNLFLSMSRSIEFASSFCFPGFKILDLVFI